MIERIEVGDTVEVLYTIGGYFYVQVEKTAFRDSTYKFDAPSFSAEGIVRYIASSPGDMWYIDFGTQGLRAINPQCHQLVHIKLIKKGEDETV